MSREDLEKQALTSVCSCWYYELSNDIETLSDDELNKIINNGMYLHLQNQLYNPVASDEFMQEIMECASVNFGVKKG